MTSSPSLNVYKIGKAQKVWLGQLLGGRPDFIQSPALSEKGLYCGFQSYYELVHAITGNESISMVEVGHALLSPLHSNIRKSISRDPEMWDEDFTALGAGPHVLFFAPVDPRDGYCLEAEFAKTLIQKFKIKFPGSHVIIVDDVGSFSWGASERPLRLSQVDEAEVIWSTNLRELGIDEGLPIWIRAVHPERIFKAPPSELIQSSDLLLAALFNRDIPKGITYLRRSTQAKRRFRRIGDAIQPALQSGYLEVSHWPLSGLSFHINLRGKLREASTQLLEKQAEEKGIFLDWDHSKKSFRVNIAITSKQFGQAPEELGAWIEQLLRAI